MVNTRVKMTADEKLKIEIEAAEQVLRQVTKKAISTLVREGVTDAIQHAIEAAIITSSSQWQSVRSACAYLGVSRGWLHKVRSEGRLPAYTDDHGSVRFKRSDLDSLFQPAKKTVTFNT